MPVADVFHDVVTVAEEDAARARLDEVEIELLVERLDLDTGFMQNVCQGAVSCTEVAKRDAAGMNAYRLALRKVADDTTPGSSIPEEEEETVSA